MNIIAIFDNTSRPMAFVSVEGQGEIVAEIEPGNDVLAADLKKLVAGFKIDPPRLKSETVSPSGVSVEMLPVSPKNENFLTAVTEELDRAGFVAKIIPGQLKMLLKYVSLKSNTGHRHDVINEIINTTTDISTEELIELEDVLADIITLKAAQLDSEA